MDFVRIACRLALAGTALHLAACTNMSGLGGGSEFQCKAPEGIPCQSISGVHHNERAGNLPAQRAAFGLHSAKPDSAAPQSASTAVTAEGGPTQVEQAATASAVPVYRKASTTRGDQAPAFGAIRSEPTVIRIWVAPWEDADGDLNDQSYVYLQIDSGRWLVEHNRAQIRREFAPQRAMPVAVGGPVEPAAARPAITGSAPGALTSSSGAAAPAAPAAGAKMLTKEEAIAMGKAQAQAQALKAGKPAEASEVRP